jgi:aryl-alcohol dehydrogenase-like predicted oxidoreductase
MLRLCADQGVGVIPWSPLARGHLARPPGGDATKREQGDNFAKTLYTKTVDIDTPVVERLADLAKKRGVPMAQLAMAWLLHKPVITAPIVGATKPHHLDDAVAAVSIKLSPEEMKSLEELYRPHEVAGFS